LRNIHEKERVMHPIIVWIVLGLVAGILARMVMPGSAPGGILVTIVVGIVGGVLGGWLGAQMGLGTVDGINIHSFLLAAGGAILVLLGLRLVQRR
jgi:uncharacterized membrane protein YeaQ/YmgE (transglycosylase-associated protein family)